MKKKITDILSLSGIQGINMLLPLAIIPFLILKIGIDGYGRYAFAFAFANYFNIIIDFGYNLSNVQRISVVSENLIYKSKIFCSTIISKLLILLLSTIICLLVIFLTSFNEYNQELLIVYLIIFSNAFNTIWYFQGIEKIKIYSFINLFCRIAVLPLLIIFVKTENDLLIALAIMSLPYFLVSSLSLIYLFKMNQIKIVKVSRTEVISGIKHSWPVFISTSSMGVYTQLIILFLGITTSAASVGLYSILTKLSSAIYTIFFYPISQVYLPVISKIFKKSYKKGLKEFQLIKKNIFILMFLLVVIYFFFGKYLLLFLKPELLTSKVEYYFKALSFVPLFMALGATYGQLGLLAIGSDISISLFKKSYLTSGIMATLIGFILINFYGLDGAILTIVIVELIVFLLLFLNFRNLTKKLTK